MLPIYVNMQLMVDMQLSCVNLQLIYVNMWDKYFAIQENKLHVHTIQLPINLLIKLHVDINKLHIDINNVHVNIKNLHVNTHVGIHMSTYFSYLLT
jgi:hypothetical protein